MGNEKKEVETVLNVAATALAHFMNDCKQIAEKNWCRSEVKMLDNLFEAAAHGYEYKCVGCEYFGRHADAPETLAKECMWSNLNPPPCVEDED